MIDIETPPPAWLRRLLITPVVFVAALAVTILSPVIHLVAAVVDLVFDRRRWRVSRIVGICLAFCVAEVFGLFAMFTVWLGSGFGLFMNRPFWTRANNLLANQYMALVTNALAFFLGYKLTFTTDELPSGPHILLPCHAGPGDSFRLQRLVFRDLGRRCHSVGATKLQWDPFLDRAGSRLRFHFLHQSPADTVAELRRISDLAAELGAGETLLICPEGGDFTPKRRLARIEALKKAGRADRVRRAQKLRHTMLPRTGGALAAMSGAPEATVVLMAHAGLGDIHDFAGLWNAIPLRRHVRVHAWAVSSDDRPPDRAARAEWLLDHWEAVDEWIADVLEQ